MGPARDMASVRRGLALVAVLAVASACEQRPRWPVTYLLDLPGTYGDPPHEAEVDGLQRPALALGVVRPVAVALGEAVVPASRELTVPLALPPQWVAGTRVTAEAAVVVGQTAARKEVAEVAAGAAPAITLRFAPEESGARCQFVVLASRREAPGPRMRTLGPTRVAPGARLETAVAIPEGQCASLPAFTFGVDAVVAGRSRPLHRRKLDPVRQCGRWTRLSIALDAVAGEQVALRFRLRRARARDARAPLAAYVADPAIVPRRRTEPRPPNVIVVSLDTLGAKHLGVHGYPHPTSPFLDRLAERGTTFERAYAHYPSTAASHMSLFTGRLVGAHGVRGLFDALVPVVPLLAAELRRAGWTTAAVTEDATLNRTMGFARGYSEYRENHGHLYATPGLGRQTFRDALRWLRRVPHEPFFLFVHTYEVHTPYTPHRQHLRQVRATDPAPGEQDQAWHYDAEVRLLDQLVARFWRELDARGLLARTVLVVTSDHGEAFGEHGEWAHGTMLYDEVMRVPLLVSGPEVVAGQRVATPVGLVDLMPTLLALAAQPPPAGLHGRSLVPALRGEPMATRPILAELQGALGPRADGPTADQRAVWLGPEKVIHDLRRNAWLAFDLARDPGEQHDLADARPDLLDAARRELDWYATLAPPPREAQHATVPASVPPSLPPGDVERLRALGYVE